MDSRLGLNQTAQKADGPARVRTAPKGIPKRDGAAWATVTIKQEHATVPQVQCNNCSKIFCAGYTRIKTASRSRMGHAVGDKLVYCHESLHMQNKLQKAGYKAKVEKWDSDSDSDASDDEKDLAQ